MHFRVLPLAVRVKYPRENRQPVGKTPAVNTNFPELSVMPNRLCGSNLPPPKWRCENRNEKPFVCCDMRNFAKIATDGRPKVANIATLGLR
jgi:hypothetical protein